MMYIPFDFNTKTKPSQIKNSTILCQLNVPFTVSLLPCCKVLITFVHHSLPFFSWRRQLLWCDQYWRLAPPSSVPVSTAQTRPVVRSGVSRVVTTEQGTSPHPCYAVLRYTWQHDNCRCSRMSQHLLNVT